MTDQQPDLGFYLPGVCLISQPLLPEHMKFIRKGGESSGLNVYFVENRDLIVDRHSPGVKMIEVDGTCLILFRLDGQTTYWTDLALGVVTDNKSADELLEDAEIHKNSIAYSERFLETDHAVFAESIRKIKVENADSFIRGYSIPAEDFCELHQTHTPWDVLSPDILEYLRNHMAYINYMGEIHGAKPADPDFYRIIRNSAFQLARIMWQSNAKGS